MRKFIGGCLIASPLVAITVIGVIESGWKVIAIAWAYVLATIFAVLVGFFLSKGQ